MSSHSDSTLQAAFPEQDHWRTIDVLVKNKRWLYRSGTIAGVAALAFVLFRAPRYESHLVLIPPSSSSGGGLAALASMAGGASPFISEGALGVKSTGESYVSLLESETMEDTVIRRFDLMHIYRVRNMSDARKELERNVTIAYGPRDGMIRMDAIGRSPQEASDIANGYYQEFQTFSAKLAVTDAAKKRKFYQGELERAKDRLSQAEQDMKQSEDQSGLLQVEGQARALIGSAASIQGSIAAKQVQIRAMEGFEAEGNPDLIAAKEELAALQAQASRLNGTSGNSRGILLSKPELSQASLEYVRRLRNVKYYETLFEMLAKQYEAAQLEEAREGSTMQVVDRAVPPDKKMPQHRIIIVLFAIVSGMFCSALYFILRDRWHTSVFAQRLRALQPKATT